MNIFGLNPVIVFGTDEQRQRMLPPMVEGKEKACFGVTEPNTGLNTTQLKLRAERRGDRYVVNGQKVWISTAQVADKILLLARTTPLETSRRRPTGSVCSTPTSIATHQGARDREDGSQGVDSNELFFEDFEIPVEDRSARKAAASNTSCTA